MRLVPRIVAPTEPADFTVTLADAKKFCGVDDHTEDDAELEAMLRTAFEWLQPPFGCLRISIAPQTLRLDLPRWPTCSLELPAGPVASIGSVKYFDDDNAEQTLPANQYFLDNDTLMWTDLFAAPSLYARPSAVKITYDAGYDGDENGVLPATIKTAVLQCVKTWYDNRDVVQSVGALSMMALGVDDLIASYRVR